MATTEEASTTANSGDLHITPTVSSPARKPPPKRYIKSQIPESLLTNPALNSAISLLPSNYSFEIHKTLHRISTSGSTTVSLQFPDGLLMFSLPIADILRSFSPHPLSDVLILADPTYGACCLDDHAAYSLSSDLLVHYGHSCLVPVTSSLLPTLYVFVEIKIDSDRLIDCIRTNFPKSKSLALAGTIQFISAVHAAKALLSSEGYNITVPQSKPLSAGEVLGCTAPAVSKTKEIDALIFVADGRFHLEAFMIANPKIPAYRFDPFLGVLVLEQYDHEGMRRTRKDMILRARNVRSWGVILGTLGRQGSTRVLERVCGVMEENGLEYTVVLMSEISPARVELFEDQIDAWVQIACPRLSIDWGEGFKRPLLTTFEFDVAMGKVKGWWEREEKVGGGGDCGSCGCKDEGEAEYPMDYYAQDGGDWNGAYVKKKASVANGTKV